MAVAVIQRFPEGTGASEYDPSPKARSRERPARGADLPLRAGTLNGRFEVLDVWETRESFDRFVEERLIPAQREVMGDEVFAAVPGLEIIEAPVHRHFTA